MIEVMESGEKVRKAAEVLKMLGFAERKVEDEVTEEVKKRMPRKSFILIDDCNEAPGWTQDFVLLVAKGRDGSIVEVTWFGPKTAVY